MPAPTLYPIIPGGTIPDDWYGGTIPVNIVVGDNSVIDSSFCFKYYEAVKGTGLQIGSHVTVWRTSLAVGPEGVIEIGDYSYLANASLVCAERITIGSHVLIANGVTIADSDFHPIELAARVADSVAVSPLGERRRRPEIGTRPVIVGDGAWIGFNATILKGVHVGAGAVIAPGAVVNRDVPVGAYAAGNPAHIAPGGGM
ncbi:MAG: acyltransferase [Dehalococcoidia bacterium]